MEFLLGESCQLIQRPITKSCRRSVVDNAPIRPASQPLDPRAHVDGLALDLRRMFLPNRVLLSCHMPLKAPQPSVQYRGRPQGSNSAFRSRKTVSCRRPRDIRSPLVRAVQHVRHHRGSLSPGWCCSAQTPRQDSRSPALKHLPLTTPEPCLDRPQIRGRWPGCPNPRLSRPAPAPSAPRTPVSQYPVLRAASFSAGTRDTTENVSTTATLTGLWRAR